MHRRTSYWAATVFTLALVALVSSNGWAGDRFSIRGKVIRSQDDAPVAGAMVFTLPPTHVSCTRSDGTFSMGNIHVETADVYIYKRGYGLERARVIFGGETRRRHVDTVLEPETSSSRIFGPTTCKPKRRIVSDDEQSIVGTVIRDRDGRRLSGVDVRTYPTTRSVRTNVFGHYALRVPKRTRVQRYLVRARKGSLRGQGSTNMPGSSPYTRFIDMVMRPSEGLTSFDGGG